MAILQLIFFFSGSEDNFCRLDSVVRSTEYCDNYIVKIIENAGHWPHQEMPLEFNRVILKFLVGKVLANRFYFVEIFIHFYLFISFNIQVIVPIKELNQLIKLIIEV